MTTPDGTWISVDSAAEYAGVDGSAIICWLQNEGLPGRYYKTGWKIHVRTLEKWLIARGLREDAHNNSENRRMKSVETPLEPPTQMSLSSVAPNATSNVPLFARAVMKEAISILPSLPSSTSIVEQKEYLRSNLHYNSVQTRDRFASYILKHIFPSGKPDLPLLVFAKKFPESRSLKDVCFYRFMKSQPLMQLVLESVFLPVIGQGVVSKGRIYQYLQSKFPSAKSESLKATVGAICEALTACSMASLEKQNIRFNWREIDPEAFAFVIHSEFSEPDTYNLQSLHENPALRMLLWSPEKLLPALYELRNKAILSKISNIDSLRQFTTIYRLEQLVDALDSLRVTA